MRRRDFIAGLSSAAALPLAAQAQQRSQPVVGYLSSLSEGNTRFSPAFRQGLAEQGFVEPRNVQILYRYAEARYDRLPKLAADLVARRVAVIFCEGVDNTAIAAKSATTTIPIVFSLGGDPVNSGLVASLNRPGGNLTGAYFLLQTLEAKRLELIHEIVPNVTRIGFLVNPDITGIDVQVNIVENAARTIGVRLLVAKASTLTEIQSAFATLIDQQIGGLVVGGDALFFVQRGEIAALANYYGLPTIYPAREFVQAGGLMSYGANLSDAWHVAGTYVGRILKGEKPSDLPVQQSSLIETVLNLNTAKTLGIEVPTATLLRATEVIE